MTYHGSIHRTKHLAPRMSQRGISEEMLGLVCDYGDCCEAKYVLGGNRLGRLLAELAALSSLARRVRDEGGLVVVEKDGAQPKSYNLGSYRGGRGR